MPKMRGSLSTVYFGSYALGRPGGICRKRMEIGRMYTAGPAGGATRESEM